MSSMLLTKHIALVKKFIGEIIVHFTVVLPPAS